LTPPAKTVNSSVRFTPRRAAARRHPGPGACDDRIAAVATRACGAGIRWSSRSSRSMTATPRSRLAKIESRTSRHPSVVLTQVPSVWNSTSPSASRNGRHASVVADRADGVVADDQPGDVAQQPGGPLERALGPEPAQQPLGVRADEPLQPEPVVQGVGAAAAGAAGEVDPREGHVAGGEEPPPRLAVAPAPRRRGRTSRAPFFLQAGGLGVEDALEAVADEPAAAIDGGRLDHRQDMPVGGGVGQLLQLPDHRQRLLDGDGLDLVLGDKRAGNHRAPPWNAKVSGIS
jgi:hypothetical protein